MIQSFRGRDTEELAVSGTTRRWQAIQAVAIRKLEQLEDALLLEDLRSPPGNHLEALSGDREGQHSIRINHQWQICFFWKDGGAHEVEIVDYH